MKSKRFALRAWLVAGLLAGSVLAAPPPSMNAPELGQGPYSSMHMLLEKTILKVDVLTVDVRVSKSAQSKLAALAQGKSYTADLGKQLADVAIKSDHALVQLTFKRDVGLDMWIEAVRENLQQARAAGLISAALEKRVSAGLPGSFQAIQSRGYKTGDRVLYRVKPESLRTVVVTKDGTPLIDRTDKDEEAARVVMASYLAPGSDFREPLLRSLK